MKQLPEQRRLSSSTTTEEKNKLQVKENKCELKHTNKLNIDHNVTISNTMIKITYKKALKDQNAVEDTINCSNQSELINGKSKPTDANSFCNSSLSVIMKSPKVQIETSRHLMFHSTPKHPQSEKKKYVNGTHAVSKLNNSGVKNCVVKVQKMSFSQEDWLPNQKTFKTDSDKSTTKPRSDKKSVKGESLEKPRASINQSSSSDAKKLKLLKGSDKKIEKLENGVKKETVVGKEIKKPEALKRKASNSEFSVVAKYKKTRTSGNDAKDNQSPDGKNKRGGKKPIMLVDPDLPAGWTRFIRTKNKGSDNEQYVVYVVNPQGKKFRFKWKLREYLLKTNSSLSASQFFFGLYKRRKTSNAFRYELEEKGHSSSSRCKSSSEVKEEAEESDNLDGKEILFYDPDLPFGWKRKIHSKGANGRKQVHIISPDGKIFRRRYRLQEYLVKHEYTHSLDRFYFGLYSKKEETGEDKTSSSMQIGKEEDEEDEEEEEEEEEGEVEEEEEEEDGDDAMKYNGRDFPGSSNSDSKDVSEIHRHSPMQEDPNLPEGWKRFIKMRSYGETAGRMEVIIVSPDGRKHRTKKHLEHYLKKKQLGYKVEDFDFTVFGKSSPRRRTLSKREHESDFELSGRKKKFRNKPVPDLDIDSLKETVISPEGRLINTVNALMMCSGLSSVRNVRRQKLPRGEDEKILKRYLDSAEELTWEGNGIPTGWVERLVKCRADLRDLEPEAVSAIADATKEFLKKLSMEALANSKEPETGLKYEDLADIVDRTRGLSFLRTLVPKKITFREFLKVNRPKPFISFT